MATPGDSSALLDVTDPYVPAGRVDLVGAIDMHCHFGPDPHRRRSVDALELAMEATAAGYAGVVLKSHDYPTAAVAALVEKAVGGARLFGSICCDAEVGGVNPAAVEAALRIGAKVVWLPTHSSRLSDPGSKMHPDFAGGDIAIVDDSGALLEETLEVLALVLEHDAIVATGHTSRAEHFAVVREYASKGTVVVTHARQTSCQPDLSVADCVALAELGATIEFSAITCLGPFAGRPVAEVAQAIEAVGVERCIVSTDFGQRKNPHPAEGLQLMADALVEAGINESSVRRMVCETPARLLRLAG